jgi:hypothetical protein
LTILRPVVRPIGGAQVWSSSVTIGETQSWDFQLRHVISSRGKAGKGKSSLQAVCRCNEAENLTVGIMPREETERLRLPGDRVGPYPSHAAKFLTG